MTAANGQMTDKAAEAFAAYVDLGPGRSLEALARRYKRSTEPVPTKHVQTLKTWSAKYGWQARISDAVTAAVTRKLEQAAELDADTFLKTSQRLNDLVNSPGYIDPGNVTRVRESVRKAESKSVASIDVRHSGTVKHAHHDMSMFTDDELEAMAAIAERHSAEVAQ